MRIVIKLTGVLNPSQCPQITQQPRLHKHRRYLSPKFQGQYHQGIIINRSKCIHSLYFCHAETSSNSSFLHHQEKFQSYASTASIGNHNLGYRFDPNSFQIGVDNQCLLPISNNLDHFISPPSLIPSKSIGVNGVNSILAKETVC